VSIRRRIFFAIVIVVNVATVVMLAFILSDSNKRQALNQPFLDTWEHHADPASAPSRNY
jgi:hypothetical protein